MKILGISSFYHDSAATIIEDGEIVAAAQEERFTRKKHDSSFPTHAIKYCLNETVTNIDNLYAIAFYDKPLLKFERLLETFYAFAPKGLRAFIMAIPVWLREKMFLKKIIIDELKTIQEFDKKKVKLLFPEHHHSHAAGAYYLSPFEDAAIITVDGVGEWATASICHGKGKDITILKELHFPHSLGLLYSAFTYFLGFRVNSGEYKLMGLAPYGNPQSVQVKHYIDIIKKKLIKINDDGSIWLNQKYFNYAVGLTMVDDKKWEKLFGFPRRNSSDELQQHHCNLGLAIQEITEEIVIKMAEEAKRLTGSKNICLSGGVALNCVANGKLQNTGLFDKMFIQPASGDAGGSLGAAMAAYHEYFEKDRKIPNPMDSMKGSLLGPAFDDKDAERMAKQFNAKWHHYKDFDKLADDVTDKINEGKVVGWMQGRMEFGPRALGNRSILGDARNPEMQKRLNLKIKYRESFRPFAPSVLAEEAPNFFEMKSHSPYMILVQNVVESRRNKLPDDYHNFEVRDKLYYQRSDVPAITHIDFSARIQTVHKETNPRYWHLINTFKQKTGYGIIVNTSFNVRGEPIVCTPEDAYRCFMRTEMDYLVINNKLFIKTEQPAWQEKKKWQEDFVLD